jgi:hypothetical protein
MLPPEDQEQGKGAAVTTQHCIQGSSRVSSFQQKKKKKKKE